MAVRAADFSKARLASLCGCAALIITRNYSAWNIHSGLKDRRRGDVANSHLVRETIFVKIICRDDVSPVVFLAYAETLNRLHAVMMVEGVDCKDAHRVDAEVRMNGTLFSGFRFVGAPAPVAAGRPWPSSNVQRAAKISSPISSRSSNSISPDSISF
jgi:hypothetical protein